MIKKKKMNTYIKYILILLVSLLIGGCIGLFISFFNMDSIGDGTWSFVKQLRGFMFPLLTAIGLVSILFGEYVLKKNKELGERLHYSEDEESDSIEYEIEKVGAWGTVGNTVFSVLSLLVLSTGYSLEYIKSLNETDNMWLLASFMVFIVESFYSGFWQIRFIKGIQKVYPEKAGDPASGKFQKQWLESCDEAEKEVIYQASYKTYLMGMKLISALAFVSLFTHLVWNTGVMAVAVLGVVWIVMTVTYCRNCVRMKEKRINT